MKGVRGDAEGAPPSLPSKGTRQLLLDAARDILAEGGVSALTVDAVTRRAGVNKAAVSYYFGGKASLVALVVDLTVQEMALEAARAAEKLPLGEGRIACHMAGQQRMTENDEAYRAWFGVFPMAYGDAHVRERISAAYDWYVDINRECLGDIEGATDQQVEGLARLITAVADGLAAQRGMTGGRLDVTESFRLFSRMLTLVVDDFLEVREDVHADASKEAEQPPRC